MPEKPVVLTKAFKVYPREFLRMSLDLIFSLSNRSQDSILIEKMRSIEEKIAIQIESIMVVLSSFNWWKADGSPIQDISKSGIYTETDLDITPGTKVDLAFSIPGYKKPIRVEGEVVRKIEVDGKRHMTPGLGVRFKGFQGDSQKRLDKYILKSQSDDPKLVYYL